MAREKHLFILHDEFVDAAEKLDRKDKAAVFKTLRLLKTNDQHPSLNVEPVKGSKEKVWSCRVTLNVRLIFSRIGDLLEILYVGRHDDAYRFGEKAIPIASMAALVAAGGAGLAAPGAVVGAFLTPPIGAITAGIGMFGAATGAGRLLAEAKKEKNVKEMEIEQIGKEVLGLSRFRRFLALLSRRR